MSSKNITVIGGGPAGMMASITASRNGRSVTLFEKNRLPGKKLLLTGNGRCNLTNTADIDTFMSMFGKNGRFLRNAYFSLPPSGLIDFFEKRGLRCNVEKDGKVFPLRKRSVSVLSVLERELTGSGVTLTKNTSVGDIIAKNGRMAGVVISNGDFIQCDTVILCTGGVSYPSTGSSGDGLKFAHRLGHRIIPPSPGLVPLITRENYPEKLEGLSLSGVGVRIKCGGRTLKKARGDIMFTSRGMSGPVILSNSGMVATLLRENMEVSICIDVLPEIPVEKIGSILTEYIRKNPSRSIKNCIKDLAAGRLLELILSLSVSDPDKISNQVPREERSQLISLLKNLTFTVTDTCPIEEAMVTAGGVSLDEVDPRTMSSRIIPGLFFAGEILDIAGDTGGFNLQAAFSTGYLAGKSSAKNIS